MLAAQQPRSSPRDREHHEADDGGRRARARERRTTSSASARARPSLGESTVFLRAGEELTVADLVRATLIPSANDAAQALALHVGPRICRSVRRPHERQSRGARALETRTSRIPTASTQRGHVSSARDVDDARALRARCSVHPRRALANVGRPGRRPGRSRRPTTCSRAGRRSSAGRRAIRGTRAGRRRRRPSAAA